MSAPPHGSVLPLRYVASVDEIRAFYLEKLGFEHLMGVVGKDGGLQFAIVQFHGAGLMFSRPEDPEATTKGPLELFIESKDVDAYHQQVRRAGVPIARAIETQWYGDRNFAIEDPAGCLVWFWQCVGKMEPPPGITVI